MEFFDQCTCMTVLEKANGVCFELEDDNGDLIKITLSECDVFELIEYLDNVVKD